MNTPAKPPIKDLIAQIVQFRSNVSAVARHYGRPRSTVQSWIDASPTATQALNDAREERVDTAEMVVYKAASEENLQGAFYILNNDPKAKERGWGPRHEITSKDGEPMRVKVIDYGLDDDTDTN